MSRAAIVSQLIQKIESLGLPYPRKYPNAPFTTPTNTSWVVVSFLLGDGDMLDLAHTDEIIGIVQLDVYSPKASGRSAGYQVADIVEAGFSKKVRLTGAGYAINVTSVAAGNGTDEESWHRNRIEVNLRIFRTRV